MLIICGVLTGMVAVIVGSRLLLGGAIAPLSVALPLAGIAWVAWIGLKIYRFVPPLEVARGREERPSRRVPRFDPAAGGRPDRPSKPSDSGRHVNV